MTTTTFMPSSDSGKAELLAHLNTTLPKYAALLDVNDPELGILNDDAIAFQHSFNTLHELKGFTRNWTAYRNMQRDGGSGSFDWPPLSAPDESVPPAVSFGIIPRLSALAARLKTHRNYTTAIGQDLWLVSATHISDSDTWKPVLSIQSKVGHPVVAWTKGKANALEVWVDRGDGKDFSFLTINTEPNTTDTFLTPVSGTTAIWKYNSMFKFLNFLQPNP